MNKLEFAELLRENGFLLGGSLKTVNGEDLSSMSTTIYKDIDSSNIRLWIRVHFGSNVCIIETQIMQQPIESNKFETLELAYEFLSSLCEFKTKVILDNAPSDYVMD